MSKIRASEHRYQIGQVVWGMEIIEQTRVKKYKDGNKTMKSYNYKCTLCQYEGKMSEDRMRRMKSVGCSCCKGQVVSEKINSIVAKKENHWMIEYFQNGYDEAKLYAPQSNKTIEMICPICKTKKRNTICNLYNRRTIGCSCGSGISKLERVFSEILKLNNVEFVKEYRLEGYDDKRYDFFIPKLGVIVECHGGQHYKISENSSWGTAEEQQENDKLKYDRAVNRGFNFGDTYFVVNCKEDKVEDIYKQVTLLPFISLTEEQFKQCLLSALEEDLKLVLDCLKHNPKMSKNDLCRELGMSKEKISSLLRKAVNQKIVNYDTKTYERLKTPGRKVFVYKEEELVYTFDSISLACRELKGLIGFPYKETYLRKLCLSQGKYEVYNFSF